MKGGDAPAEDKDPQHYPDFREALSKEPLVLHAIRSSYIQHLDADRLLAVLAGAEGTGGKRMIVEVPSGPGFFVSNNDPTTSMQVMDRIEAIITASGEKALPPRVQEREVDRKKVLLRIGCYDFEGVVGLVFDQLRRGAFTSGKVAALERLLEVIGRALEANDTPERQKALWKRAFAVGRLAPGHVSDP